MGKFIVLLDRIEHLRDEDTLGKSDPYVKFSLEQDNYFLDKDFGTQQSSKKTNDLSPEYNETFEFDGVKSMNNMKLHVQVMDDDIGIDDKIGSCELNLEGMGLNEEPLEISSIIDHKKGGGWFSKKAKIYLHVSFVE